MKRPVSERIGSEGKKFVRTHTRYDHASDGKNRKKNTERQRNET